MERLSRNVHRLDRKHILRGKLIDEVNSVIESEHMTD